MNQITEAAKFSLKREILFVGLIFLSILLFFPEMFSLKMSFLSGDHRAQHYPWAYFYAESIRHFQFPWWTNYFHSGFPLLAEGQVGAFYPLNAVFYFILPVFAAYTYGILFHYFLGGAIFYSYLRTLKLSNWASLFATVVYLFGTAQAGYYYNIISLKVLIWLPLTFLLMDQIIQKKKYSFTFLLGAVFALQFFGGYLQYAVYSIGFSILYFLWFSIKEGLRKFPALILCLISSLILGFIIASPQLLPTFELAGFSNRFSFTEEFAYVGSMNPLSFVTLFFPHWDSFLRTELYVGAAGLFFVIVSLFSKKRGKEIFFLVMAIFAMLLALGKFDPLYVAAIKITHFYGFRIPSKFIFFAAVALSILSAYGFDKWIEFSLSFAKQRERGRGEGVELKIQPSPNPLPSKGEGSVPNLCKWVFAFLTAASVTLVFLVNAVLRWFEGPIKQFLESYIVKHYTGSTVHTQPVEVYLERMNGLYASILNFTSPHDVWNWLFPGFLVLTLIWVFASDRMIRQKKIMISSIGFVILIYANLYAYGFTSIKGNYENYSFLKSELNSPLSALDKNYRIHRAPSSVIASDHFPIVPHSNMLNHLSITGAYSPLVMKDYYELMSTAGDVNDSKALLVSNEGTFSKNLPLLRFMNVKYVMSDLKLNANELKPIGKTEEVYLYELSNPMPKAFFVPDLKMEDMSNYVPADMLTYGQQTVTLKLLAPRSGYLVLSDIDYPGWKVWVNGRESKIVRANKIFRAVQIPEKGEYEITFIYDPVWKKLSWVPWTGLVVCILIPALLGILSSRTRLAIGERDPGSMFI